MPMVAKGIYLRPDNKTVNRERASVYQLNYYVQAASLTVDFIQNPRKEIFEQFENPAQYYRYFSDTLFFHIGEIANRITDGQSMPRDSDVLDEKKEYLADNEKNFFLSEDDYSILKNKKPRNIIEHLDERNLKTIMDKGGVGGFNVLTKNGSDNLRKDILENREFYPYILDLENSKFLFFNIQHGDNEDDKFTIDIAMLKGELEQLRRRIDDFGGFI